MSDALEQGKAKPFGWLGKWNNGTYDFFTTQEEVDKWAFSGALQVTPVYTVPPSTAEVKAQATELALWLVMDEWEANLDDWTAEGIKNTLLSEAKRLREEG